MPILFVGSYTEMISPDFGGHGCGIYTVELNDQTGEIQLLHCARARNPAYLTLSDDRKFLYAINELVEEKQPKIQAYGINADYSLSLLNEVSISGSLPCHINCLNDSVFVACYGTGSVFQFKTQDGLLCDNPLIYYHSGSSINKTRQEGPHAHQIAIHPNNKEIYVPDLGLDKIKSYHLSDNKLQPNYQHDIEIPDGSGPRHMVFNEDGTLAYLLNELSGTVSILKRVDEAMVYLKSVESLPESFNETPSASAIRMHPNGQYLYAANRTLEAITIFKINGEELQLISYKYLQGKTLREFNISPNGKWLIVCLQDSDDTYVFKIQIDGKLSQVFHTKEIKSGVCLVFS